PWPYKVYSDIRWDGFRELLNRPSLHATALARHPYHALYFANFLRTEGTNNQGVEDLYKSLETIIEEIGASEDYKEYRQEGRRNLTGSTHIQLPETESFLTALVILRDRYTSLFEN